MDLKGINAQVRQLWADLDAHKIEAADVQKKLKALPKDGLDPQTSRLIRRLQVRSENISHQTVAETARNVGSQFRKREMARVARALTTLPAPGQGKTAALRKALAGMSPAGLERLKEYAAGGPGLLGAMEGQTGPLEQKVGDRLEKLFSKLDGMNKLKISLQETLLRETFEKARGQNPNLSFILSGAPRGEGLTLARTIGQAYKITGMLPKGHLVEVDAGELMTHETGSWRPGFSDNEIRTQIGKAMGGVLYIQDAHLLGEDTVAASAVVARLAEAMHEHRGEFCMIFDLPGDKTKLPPSLVRRTSTRLLING